MSRSIDTRTKLLTEKPFKLMVNLSLPAIIGMLVIGLYNFVDSIFVGHMIGPEAMGAVSVAYTFTFINSGIATLIGVGSASVLSRAIGKNDKKTIDKMMGNLIVASFVLSSIITILGILFTRELLSLSGAEGQILEYAEDYLKIIFAGSIFVNFAQTSNMVMRGEGLLKRAMMIMGIGAVLNIILDPIFITIFSRYGKGIEGAAIATVIAQIVQAIITLWYFKKKSVTVKIGKLEIDKKILKEVLTVGSSAMIMQITQLVQQVIMYNVAANYGGGDVQILLGAVLRLQAFAFIPLWGMCQGFQPAVGTNFGAKNYDRVKEITVTFIKGITVLACFFYVPIMLFPKTMLSLFINDVTIVANGVSSLQIFFSTYITLGLMLVSITLFQAIGKASFAGMLTLARQVFMFIPLVYIIPKLWNLGALGIFIAPVITDILILFTSIYLLRKVFAHMGKTRSG